MASADEARAIALFQAGRLAEAEPLFRAALARDPANADALHALGVIAMQTQRLDDAIAFLRRATDAQPRAHLAFYHLGSALRRAGHLDDALAAFRRALTLNPRSAEAHVGIGNTLREMRDPGGARASFRAALAIEPALAVARRNLGLVATEEGNALREAGELEAAAARWREALEWDPAQPAALLNSGSVALERGDRAAARAFYERALAADPQLADAQYGLGVLALFEHEFARGWDGYERRFETTPPVASIAAPHLPRLSHVALSQARRVAVRAEQGLGDQILFSTLLPELLNRNVGTVVEIDPRLATIYRRSLPELEFDVSLQGCDFEIPLGSLPRLFRPSLESFEAQPAALLRPEPRRVDEIARFLGSGAKIAVSWRSFQQPGRLHVVERKSLPLASFEAFARSGVRLVDVQYGDVSAERRAFDERHRGLRFEIPGLDPRDDIEGVLAAIAACDLVVTASNVTAHFAGAIGKRTWLVCLAANPPFHYWAPRPDGRSLWYPSVEIVTDASWTSWDLALAAAAERLARESLGR